MTKQPQDDLILSLPLPKNYFEGQRSNSPFLPGNVLCWHPHELGVGQFQHYRFVLMMAAKGAVTIIIDEHTFRLSSGQALLCFPFQQHSFVDADTDRSWLFTGFELTSYNRLSRLKNRVLMPNPESWIIARQLVRTFLSRRRRQRSCLLTGLLLDELLHTGKNVEAFHQEDRGRQILDKANSYIWTHLNSPLAIKEVADACSVSPSHLRLLFRTIFNKSLGRYIRETKMNRACDLLATTELTVTEVADLCGFDTVYSFSRSFKNLISATPSSYRHEFGNRNIKQHKG